MSSGFQLARGAAHIGGRSTVAISSSMLGVQLSQITTALAGASFRHQALRPTPTPENQQEN